MKYILCVHYIVIDILSIVDRGYVSLHTINFYLNSYNNKCFTDSVGDIYAFLIFCQLSLSLPSDANFLKFVILCLKNKVYQLVYYYT